MSLSKTNKTKTNKTQETRKQVKPSSFCYSKGDIVLIKNSHHLLFTNDPWKFGIVTNPTGARLTREICVSTFYDEPIIAEPFETLIYITTYELDNVRLSPLQFPWDDGFIIPKAITPQQKAKYYKFTKIGLKPR